MPIITPLPTAPARSMAPDVFATTADAFLAALPGFAIETEALNTSVSGYATSAASSASTASTQASNASASATTATTQAGNALTQANSAASSASTATTQAGIATAVKNDFAAKYLGTFTNAAIPSYSVVGSQYFNSTTNSMMVSNGSSWLSAGATTNGTSKREVTTATASQTVFTVTGGYDATLLDVYKNGIKLLVTTEYVETNSTTITLVVGATNGDKIETVAFGSFVPSGMVDILGTHDMTGPIKQVAGGTAALPSYTFTGSTSTGIYSSAANVLNVSVSGVLKATFDTAGLSLANALPVLSGGTGVTTSTGSGNNVLSTSPTLITPILGTPTSGVLTSCTGLPMTTGVTGTLGVANGGTGSTTSTGSGSTVLSTSPTFTTPLLGTPTSGVLTNCTGLPLGTTGVTGLLSVVNGGSGVGTSTGSGNNVLSTSPTLITPILGTPTSGVLTSCTGLPMTTGVTGTLGVANGGTGSTTSTGSGSTVLSTSPTLTTPILGTPTSGNLANCTLSSGQVTTALTYTPLRTNPTRDNSTDINSFVPSTGTYALGSSNANAPSSYGTMLAINNSDVNTQLYMSYSGGMYYRGASSSTLVGTAWRTIWDSTNLTNNNQLSNGAGYLISSGTIANATTAASCSGNSATATTANNLAGYPAGYAAASGGTSAACSGNAATASIAAKLSDFSGVTPSYKYGFTTAAITNPGHSWGKACMIYDGNGQTYGIGVDYADTAGSAPANGGTSAACSGNAASATTSAACSGNAASATTVTINYSNASNSSYQILWGSGTSVYGTSNLVVNPSTGAITSSGNITAFSDERLKTDWTILDNTFVESLASIKSGTYTRIDTEDRQVGVSAQSLQTLMPEAVLENEDGMLSVAYGNAALAACIELAKRVVYLEQELNKLKGI